MAIIDGGVDRLSVYLEARRKAREIDAMLGTFEETGILAACIKADAQGLILRLDRQINILQSQTEDYYSD